MYYCIVIEIAEKTNKKLINLSLSLSLSLFLSLSLSLSLSPARDAVATFQLSLVPISIRAHRYDTYMHVCMLALKVFLFREYARRGIFINCTQLTF